MSIHYPPYGLYMLPAHQWGDVAEAWTSDLIDLAFPGDEQDRRQEDDLNLHGWRVAYALRCENEPELYAYLSECAIRDRVRRATRV